MCRSVWPALLSAHHNWPLKVETTITELFKQYPHLSFLISVFIGILIAIIGVVPGIFLTAANILFFGFWEGITVSFFGEAIGAAIAFILYRKGFKNATRSGFQKYEKIKRLLDAEGREAFILVFSLRLIPFVPSSIITFTAAVGKASFYVFFIASTLGKLPALFMEAYSAYQLTQFGWQGQLVMALLAIGGIYFLIKKRNKNRQTGS